MKKTTTLLSALLFAAASGHAQISAGTVTYDEATHLSMDLPPEMAQFRSMIPKEMHSTCTLTFSADAAIYQRLPPPPSKAPAAGPEDGGTAMVVTMGGGGDHDDILYNDLRTGQSTEQRDLFGKKFLISDAMKKRAWHNTGRQKKLLGYDCQEALSTTDNDTVTAWFTTAIPVPLGPKDISGLPGLILEASQGGGGASLTITATKVEDGPGAKALPQVPAKGKKVTRAEFAAIEKAKMKEMQEQFGGHGNMIIHIDK